MLPWFYVYFSNDTLTHHLLKSCHFTGVPQPYRPGYFCFTWYRRLYSMNGTIEYNLYIAWNAINITEGLFSQLNNNGDHMLKCIIGKSNASVTITGK